MVEDIFIVAVPIVLSLERIRGFYENALYEFTFDIHIDIKDNVMSLGICSAHE